jgi:hypothetical protein
MLREEHRLRTSENRASRRMFGPRGITLQETGEYCIMRSCTDYDKIKEDRHKWAGKMRTHIWLERPKG